MPFNEWGTVISKDIPVTRLLLILKSPCSCVNNLVLEFFFPFLNLTAVTEANIIKPVWPALQLDK